MMCNEGSCVNGMKMCAVHQVARALVLIGALNWGLVAIDPSWDLVGMIFGGQTMIGARIVFGLVGISAFLMLFVGKCCMKCRENCCKDGVCTAGSAK